MKCKRNKHWIVIITTTIIIVRNTIKTKDKRGTKGMKRQWSQYKEEKIKKATRRLGWVRVGLGKGWVGLGKGWVGLVG
jgi:hypothetical protein